jgi:hypothetical protein
MPGGQFAANQARVSLRKVSSDMAVSLGGLLKQNGPARFSSVQRIAREAFVQAKPAQVSHVYVASV